MSKPAVFIDRDGTINEETDYIYQMEDLKLIPGSANAIKLINQAGWKSVVISNQSGVARGYFDEATVMKINQTLRDMLANQKAFIDGFYYCPHYPEGKKPYNIKCNCRKPESGMLQQAANDLNIDLRRSVVIGDKWTDVLTAQRLNIPGILVRTGFGKEQIKKYSDKWERPPDFIGVDLFDAVKWVLKNFDS